MRGRRSPPRVSRAASLCLLALLVALGGCSGSSAATAPWVTATHPALLPAIAGPSALARYHVYVTDLVTGDLALFDGYTFHVAESVHGLGLSNDGKTLFVTDVSGNALDAIPLGAGRPAVAHAVAVGAQPVHVVSSRDGSTLFVTNFAGQSVSVIDTTTWTLVKSIATPASPHGIVLSPDGRYAYVACYGGAAVAVIDVAARALAATIPIPGSEPYGIAVSAAGRYVYVSDNFANRLDVIDTASRTVVGAIGVGQRPALIARAPDGDTLYVTDGATASVHVLDIGANPAKPTVRTIIATQGYPHGVAVTPDGRYVVVANTVSRNLSVIDAATDRVVATVQSPALRFPNDVLITA
jgi:YVTN family beta-propeller protein